MSHEITIKDLEKAQLKIVWNSHWTSSDVRSYFNDLKLTIRKLNDRYWTCIFDQRNFKLADQDASALLAQTGKWIIQNGLKKASIIVGSAVAKLQLTRMAKEAGTKGVIKYVLNYDEANEFVGWQ
ncbi:MAG: hypothetical protein KAH30_01810 [Caldisericia bacterium]|nr:hypothetical protein [Caldisericia bacterium]